MTGKCLIPVLLFTTVLSAACAPSLPNVPMESRQDPAEEVRLQLAARNRQVAALEAENLQLQQTRKEALLRIDSLEKTNRQLTESVKSLSEQTQRLKEELDRQRSLVQIHEQVIKLLDDTKRTIESSLKDQIAAKGIEVVGSEEQLRVVLIDKIVFDPGSQEISEEGQTLLLALAESFRLNTTHHIIVEGHSDSVPLSRRLKKTYPSNWELAAARAGAVVRFLQTAGKVEPARLSIRSFGAYRPVASNRTEEGRRQNRRIEIVLGPAH